MIGYYDNSVAACALCENNCLTCNGAATTNCLTCDSNNHRVLSGSTCICQDGYYDDNTNAMCQACHYSCQTCTSSSSCACDPAKNRVLDSGTGLCICANKYY